MLRLLCGRVQIEVLGATPERCLNRWVKQDIAFWKLDRRSELCFRCFLSETQLSQAVREAERSQCELKVLRRVGLPVYLRRLRKRPLLWGGVLAALALSFALNHYVWFVRVAGNERVSEERILQALAEEGVCFGAWGPALNSEDLKSRMLNRIPELRWLAVNREGGVVTALCAEREIELPREETQGISHLIATRPGIIREMRVINGFAAKAPGDTVEPGDILISGVMEWTTHIQATHAAGEVYGDTLHALELLCPAQTTQKVYTGRTETCLTVIFQRKRRKISGNSGIFGTKCDRMIKTIRLTLPGGYSFPVFLETETLLEYRLEPAVLPEEAAKTLLEREARRQTSEELTVGKLESGRAQLIKKEDGYLCRASMNCLELISGTVPAELFREEYTNGETDQRGTN